jgi:hypothetical protein
VIDDRYLGIGSANFASRALRIDTEIQLTLEAKTEMERAHIRRVGEQILEHWNIRAAQSKKDVRLRPFQPDLFLGHLRWSLEKTQRIPWQNFFDPLLPWAYPIKLKLIRLCGRHYFIMLIGLLLVVWVGAFVAWVMTGVSSRIGMIGFLEGALLSLSWLLPVPFLVTAVLVVLHQGPWIGIRVVISSFWVAAALGYAFARIFPARAARLLRAKGEFSSGWVCKKLSEREFQGLISILLSSRASLQTKIISQGLCFVPLPWYILGTGMILPAILYVGLQLFIFLLSVGIPNGVLNWAGNSSGYALLVIVIYSLQSAIFKIWKKPN